MTSHRRAAFANIEEVVDLTNIGTLFAFVLVSLGVLVLRYSEPDRERPSNPAKRADWSVDLSRTPVAFRASRRHCGVHVSDDPPADGDLDPVRDLAGNWNRHLFPLRLPKEPAPRHGVVTQRLASTRAAIGGPGLPEGLRSLGRRDPLR